MEEVKKPTFKMAKDTHVWTPALMFGGKCGDMVAVRPVGEEYGGKTYLGVLLGGISHSIGAYTKKDEPDTFYLNHGGRLAENPAIFVPDLNTIIFGFESWWGPINSEADLRDITDADIDNVWYVRALKLLQEAPAAGK